jgi:hypothetical protein
VKPRLPDFVAISRWSGHFQPFREIGCFVSLFGSHPFYTPGTVTSGCGNIAFSSIVNIIHFISRMVKPSACRQLIEIYLPGDRWPIDEKRIHVRQIPHAQRRDLKAFRTGPKPLQGLMLAGRHEPVRCAAPGPISEPAAGSPVLTDRPSLADGPPLSPLGFLQQDDLFLPGRRIACRIESCLVSRRTSLCKLSHLLASL